MGEPSAPPAAPRGSVWMLAAGVAALAYAAFIPSLEGQFTNWDDQVNFTNNLKYRGLGREQLRWMFTDYAGHYMPVTWLTLGLDYVRYGMEPRGYHMTSMLFHAAASLVFFFVVLALLRKGLPEVPENRLAWGAFAGALFFAIHPLRAESVSWITERRDVVCGLFTMLTVWAWLRAQEPGPRRMWLALSTVFFALSLLSKFMAMTLPLALLALDVWPLRRLKDPAPSLPDLKPLPGPSSLRTLLTPLLIRVLRLPAWRPLFLEKAPLLLLMAAALASTPMIQKKATAFYDRKAYPLEESFVHPPYRIGFYLWKTAVPVKLSPLYPYQPWKRDPFPAKFFLAWGAALAAAGALWMFRRRRPELAVAAFVYLTLIAPVSGVFQAGPHATADRYSYFACLPFAVLFGGWAATLAGRWKAVPWTAAAVLALFLAQSWKMAGIWTNSYTLWDHAIQVGTPSPMPWISRGRAVADAGKLKEALADFEQAARIDRNERMAWDNLSDTHRRLGDFDAAIRAADLAIKASQGKHAGPYINRAHARIEKKDLAGGVEDFSKALEIAPDTVEFLIDRAITRKKIHDYDGAIADVSRVIVLQPDLLRAHLNRGQFRVAKREYEASLADFARARQLDPKQHPPLVARGAERAKLDDFAGALADYNEQLRLKPGDGSALAHRALAYRKMGNHEAALADLALALKSDPSLTPFIGKDYAAELVERAGARLQKRDLRGTVADCSEAIQVDPNSADAFTYRASARAELRDLPGALEDVEMAIRIAPKDWLNRKIAEDLESRIRKSLPKK